MLEKTPQDQDFSAGPPALLARRNGARGLLVGGECRNVAVDLSIGNKCSF
jgi:hypothetical protein